MKKVFIFSNRIARDLIKNNYHVMDIVENQQDKKRTVFVFKKNNNIAKYLNQNWNITVN